MKTIWMLMLGAGVAAGLTACDDGTGGGGTTTTANGGGDADSGTDAATGDQGQDQGGDHSADRSSSSGTMNGFMHAMGAGEFSAASEMCDPSSEGHDALLQLINTLEGDSAPEQMKNFLVGRFSKPWDGATAKAVTEEAERARYEITMPTGGLIELDLKKRDGQWWVLATPEAFKPAPMGDNEAPPSMPTPPGTEG